jgi:predicted nucleotidyltransferase
MTASLETHLIEATPRELHIVQCLLRAYLPANSKVWVFGSRAKGTARPASDLDLATDAGEALPFGTRGTLADSFSVAPLAYRVDLVDLHSINPEFRALIDAHKIALPGFE